MMGVTNSIYVRFEGRPQQQKAVDTKDIYWFGRDESSLAQHQQYNVATVCHHLVNDEERDESNSGQLSINAKPIYHGHKCILCIGYIICA